MKNLLAAKSAALNQSTKPASAGGAVSSLRALGRGLILAALTLGIGSLLLAAAYCYSQMSSATCHLLQLLLLALSAFVGGFAAGRLAGSRGLNHGLALGLLLLFCLAAVSFSLPAGGVAPLALLVKALLLLLCAGLGGIFGV